MERAPRETYNPRMPLTIIDEMKNYVGFGDADADRLRALRDAVEPFLSQVLDRFYDEILRHPGARRVLSGGEAQIERLKGHLTRWLLELFGGTYDETYVWKRAAIGHVHVQVGLAQHYMFAAMEIVRQELTRVLRRVGGADADSNILSLNKLLAIETGLMLQSYRDSYSERVRESERNTIQERLSRAEHLAEIGQLAASLAHELKNPLAGISGAIQVFRDELSDDDKRRPILAEVLRQITRLDGTVKDLLTYARPRTPRFAPVRLSALSERVTALLRSEPAFQRVQFEHSDCSQLPTFDADEHQIEQVLVNLLLNAAQASAAGGTVRLSCAADGAEVTFVVEDDGHGMDDEVARRAFEPFYTTKSRGTGLGLPICRRIVEAHAGTIQIRSAAGRGTSVQVTLPRQQRRSPIAEVP